MLVEYAVFELDPEVEPMCGQLEWECSRWCCVFGDQTQGAGLVLTPPLICELRNAGQVIDLTPTSAPP